MKCLYTIFLLCSLLTVPFSEAAARSLNLPPLTSNGVNTEKQHIAECPTRRVFCLMVPTAPSKLAARPVQST